LLPLLVVWYLRLASDLWEVDLWEVDLWEVDLRVVDPRIVDLRVRVAVYLEAREQASNGKGAMTNQGTFRWRLTADAGDAVQQSLEKT